MKQLRDIIIFSSKTSKLDQWSLKVKNSFREYTNNLKVYKDYPIAEAI